MSKLISVVASRPHTRKIGSEVIMYEMGTDYSHVSWIFWNRDRTKPRYYEAAMHGGVKFTGQRHWEARNYTVFIKHFEVSDEVYEQFLDEAMDKCGEEYSLLQNLGIKIKSIFALNKNVFEQAGDGSNCSELIFVFAKYVNLEIRGETDGNLVTPKQIVESCREMSIG